MSLQENCCIFIKISVKYVPRGQVNKKAALVHWVVRGLALNRRKTIIWTDAGMVYWRIVFVHHSSFVS